MDGESSSTTSSAFCPRQTLAATLAHEHEHDRSAEHADETGDEERRTERRAHRRVNRRVQAGVGGRRRGGDDVARAAARDGVRDLPAGRIGGEMVRDG
jgi:hypothetical protein